MNSVLVIILILVLCCFSIFLYHYGKKTVAYFTNGVKETLEAREVIDRLNKKILDNGILPSKYRNIPIHEGKKSYSVDKDSIYLCMRDKDKVFFDDNTLMYVLLHEYAHCVCKDCKNHDKKFEETLDNLVDLATKAGIYNPSAPPKTNYCSE
jgi:hypothetical protein